MCLDKAAALALARDLAPDVAAGLDRLLEQVPERELRALAPRIPETGIVALARRPIVDPAAMLADLAGPLVLLDRPTHQGNLGAVVRVAAAAGAAGVLTTGPCDPWHPSVVRGAAGLHFAVPVARVEELPATGRPLVAFDASGAPFVPGALPADAILAFGSERRGLSSEIRARADLVLALPMRPGVSSLNLATSVAAVLYAWRLAGPASGA